MKVKIRNVDKLTVEKIDKLAKKKKLNRTEFLNIYFENIALQNEIFDRFDKYKTLLNEVENSLKNNKEILELVIKHIL